MSKAKGEKSDVRMFNFASQDFIPVACHFDNETLLTKNGELLQVLQISGAFSEVVSDELMRLRTMVRSSIQENITSQEFAVWIHTVRRKANLDDPTPYPNILSQNLHDIWKDKNYWDDKFINTLYISIVHRAPDAGVRSIDGFINTLFPSVIDKFYSDYFTQTATILNNVVNNILRDLEPIGASKLGIGEIDGACYSDPLFLFRRIVNLNENNVLLPVSDCASALATYHYAVGNDQIEVIDDKSKKFAAILSIKEYHDMPEEELNRVLTLSVEFVATEVFYFIPKKEAIASFEYSDYILSISKDDDAREARDVAKMIEQEDGPAAFCLQQISIMIIGDSPAQVDEDVAKASVQLSSMGIVHVKEDINLEQTFWAQLPGNFTFLRRMAPNSSENVAALASLHNFPTGNQTNPWGRAVTLLRTEAGTPHFMNFHNDAGVGHTLIFGPQKAGRGVILNFMLSEAMKFQPTIIYIATSDSSDIFLDAIGGTWSTFDPATKISIEPNKIIGFKVDESDMDRNYELFVQAMECLANLPDSSPKIFVVHNIALLFNHPKLDDNVGELLDNLHKNNGILLATINLHRYDGCRATSRWQTIVSKLGTEVVLTDDMKDLDLQALMDLSEAESAKLDSFSAISRLFLLKQDGKSLPMELSLGGLPGILKILSASEKDLALYKEIKAQERSDPDNWVIDLYDAFINR